VFLRINDDLRRLVESHGQAVEQCTGEHIRIITLDPGRNIHKQGKACRMTFRESIAAESFQLFEHAVRIFFTIAIARHAGGQFFFKVGDHAVFPDDRNTARVVAIAGTRRLHDVLN